jgi:hypothetical protein
VSQGRYRLWAALIHEITQLVCAERPPLRLHPLVAALLRETRSDWIEWRTERTLRALDAQIAALHSDWDASAPQPTITEGPGGELRIRAPWLPPLEDAHEPAAPHPPG